jgi:hypothetical protein
MGQAAWPLGVSVRELAGGRGVERVPSWEVWDRICKLYGWPQTFVGTSPVSDGRKRPIIGLHGIPPSVGVRVHGRPRSAAAAPQRVRTPGVPNSSTRTHSAPRRLMASAGSPRRWPARAAVPVLGPTGPTPPAGDDRGRPSPRRARGQSDGEPAGLDDHRRRVFLRWDDPRRRMEAVRPLRRPPEHGVESPLGEDQCVREYTPRQCGTPTNTPPMGSAEMTLSRSCLATGEDTSYYAGGGNSSESPSSPDASTPT